MRIIKILLLVLFISGKIQAQNGHKPCGENCEISCPGGTARAIDRYCPVCGEKQKKEREQKKKDEAAAILKKNLELENQKAQKNEAYQKQKVAAAKLLETKKNEMVIAKPDYTKKQNVSEKAVNKKQVPATKKPKLYPKVDENSPRNNRLYGFIDYENPGSWAIEPSFRGVVDTFKEGEDYVTVQFEIGYPYDKVKSECGTRYVDKGSQAIIDRTGKIIVKAEVGEALRPLSKVPFYIKLSKADFDVEGCKGGLYSVHTKELIIEFPKNSINQYVQSVTIEVGTSINYFFKTDTTFSYLSNRTFIPVSESFSTNLKKEFSSGKYDVLMLYTKQQFSFHEDNIGILLGIDGSYKIVQDDWIILPKPKR